MTDDLLGAFAPDWLAIQLDYLGLEGPVPLHVAPWRLGDALALRLATGRAHEPVDADRWVEAGRALNRAIAEVARVPDSPDACRLGLQPAAPRLAFVDRFGRRHRAPFAAQDVTTIRTLVLALAPGRDGAELAAVADAIDGHFADRGFQAPMRVAVGHGLDLYAALTPRPVAPGEAAALDARLRAFERSVHDAVRPEADRHGVRLLPVAELAQHAWAWGTPAPGGPVRPLSTVVTRHEDAALTAHLWARLEAPGPAPAGVAAWPTEVLSGLGPAEVVRPPAVAERHPGLAAFFSDLDRQWARARGDLEEFAFRVLAALVGAHALAAERPVEEAPRALAADTRALKRAYRLWRAILAGVDPDGALDAPADWFMSRGLAAFDTDPTTLTAFLVAEGLASPGPRSRARPCPQPFTPRLVEWEERRAAQAAWMADRFAEGRPGLFVNNAEPSVSKTGAALALMAAHPEKRFLYLAPSHALLQDVFRRAVEAGIPAGDMVIAEGLERTCDTPDRDETVLKDMALGRPFKAMHCRPGGTCGRQASCRWHTQKADARRARILLAPTAHLAREHHFAFLLASAWGNDERDAIVIDEDPSGFLGLRRTLDAERLHAALDVLAGLEGAPPYAADLEALIGFVLGVLADPTRERATWFGGHEPDDDWRAARRLVLGRMRSLAEATDAVDDGPLLDAMLLDARSPEGVTIYQDGDGRAYTFRATPALPDRPIFILDGTAVPAFYRRALRRGRPPEFFLDDEGPAARTYIRPAGRLVQIVDGACSRAALKLPGALDRVIDSVRGFVHHRLARDPARRTLLVTYMDQPGAPFETRFAEALADLPVTVAHFGAIRGLDGYAGWDVVVVGTHRLQPAAYLDDARRSLGVEPAEVGLVKQAQAIATREARSYEVSVARYEDDALQAVFEQKTIAELVQAIARSRVLVPGHEGATAVVYSHFPLPGLLVEPVTRDAFDAAHAGAPLPSAAAGPDDKALLSALAAALAGEPGADARRLMALVERKTGRRLSPGRFARLWSGPERPDAVGRERARRRIEADLAAQGLGDPGEAHLLAELWAEAAARVAGPFWIPTSRGLLTVGGMGLSSSDQAVVDSLVAKALALRQGRASRAGS